ncbi:MAG TPA: histidine phosphatase family protein [Vicinamibacterales bacterium]|nr:histidine phosphatase family protein [Vicinamibacterales bacterium]
MTTRILLVRHGATELSAEDRFAGSTDVPLGVEGRLQVELLAQRLASESFAAVYGSPLQRAIETATIVARPHGLPVTVLDGLREIDHGRWEGLRHDEAEARYPDEYAAWQHDPFDCAPTGGEAGKAVLERAVRAFQQIVDKHPGESVLVASHKATIRLVIAHVLGFDPRGYRDRLEQMPACLNIVEMGPNGLGRLTLLNDISHYALEPRAVPVHHG